MTAHDQTSGSSNPQPLSSPSKTPGVDRRRWLATAAGSGLALVSAGSSATADDTKPAAQNELHGKIHHSVVHWCFRPMSIEQLAQEAAAMGIESVELVPPENWPTLKKYGLTCAIASSHGFARGWNHKENWPFCQEKINTALDACAEFGTKNVITFSGMLEGIDPDLGKAQTIAGLKTVIGKAERLGINLCIEPLNTRVSETMKGHPGYQCDTVEWAVDVCKAIGSPRMKLLYDIYHQQIMEGDVIVRLQEFSEYIGHYHTAGVPGRRELDDEQEINYPAIMKAIVATGYEGFVGHEFIPTWQDPMAALRHAVQRCDVA